MQNKKDLSTVVKKDLVYALDEARNTLNIIKTYCESVEASSESYSEQALRLIKLEFGPIINECDKAIKGIESL